MNRSGDVPAWSCRYAPDGTEIMRGTTGLTKRELFAAMAMQGIAASEKHNRAEWQQKAESAVRLADALLVELKLRGAP